MQGPELDPLALQEQRKEKEIKNGRKEQCGKEEKEKGYGENWFVKIQGMLRRLQADT